ncbi:MAG: hypothetical protein HZB55_13680 [Deltaproteobacteria bacterium]|nr:hypothetical protein [Deltaproteobacteria bacterium]
MSALKQTFQFVIVLCLVLLAAAAVILISRLLHWPLATVGWFVAAVALLIVAAWFGPKLWRRWAAKRAAGKDQGGDRETVARLKALRERWALLLGQLKASRVGAGGKAVDSLPWYLVLGEAGGGKTTSLRASRLTVSLGGAGGGAEGGAAGLGWSFLEGAIVLDAPASYALPKSDADRAEWGEFLSLLGRSGRRVPLDGLVLAVPADTLLRRSEEELKRDAEALRQRLDEAVRRLGVKFPVYVLVTKWDRVEGMARFFQCLPAGTWDQAFGALNDGGAPVGAFAEGVMDRLRARMGELRLVLLADPQLRESQRPVTIFPEEAAALGRPLAAFLSALFAVDPYREGLPLRGLYFSSGHQEGKAVSGLLSRLGFPEEELPAPADNRSFFLKGFFGQVLPRDRGLAAPTARALSLRSLTRNLGLTAWALGFVVLAVVLSVSFASNLRRLREVSAQVPSRADLTGRLDADLQVADRIQAAVEKLHTANLGWGLGKHLLPQARKAEEALAAEHDRRFRKGVLEPLDQRFAAGLDQSLASAHAAELAASVDFLAKRIELIKKAQAEPGSSKALARLDQPAYGVLLGGQGSPELASVFQRNYLAHLSWGSDAAYLASERSAEEELLKRVLARPGAELDWLVNWANMQRELKPVRLADFWGAEPPGAGDAAVVEGAYTPEGWAKISEFLQRITGAFPEGSPVAVTRARFEASYRRDYLARWERFLTAFPKGYSAWAGSRDRQVEIAARLGGRDSPYTRLWAGAPDALKPILDLTARREDLPGWLLLVYRWDRLRQPAYQEAVKPRQGVLGSLATKSTEVVGRFWEKIEGSQDQAATLTEDGRALPFVSGYQDSLVRAAERVRSPQASYQLAKDVFAEADLGVGEPQQPISRTHWCVNGLRRILGKGGSGEEIFWELLSRPADQIWSAVLSQAAGEIQKGWETDVLAPALSLPPKEKSFAVWGQGGKAWDFQKGAAAPFLTKALRPSAKALFGGSIPFSRGFLDGLAGGPMAPPPPPTPTRIQISALPTDANPEATARPQMTRLLLQCSSGGQELVNQNYPVSRAFNWSAQDCADVTLEIGVGNVTLKKWYSGPDGFPRFLDDFRGGRRVFRASEFPDQRASLAQLRVETISVSYVIRGSLPGAPSMRSVPERAVQ